jgi:outer membrane protein OmpA-like peptidoglycan-associated protein
MKEEQEPVRHGGASDRWVRCLRTAAAGALAPVILAVLAACAAPDEGKQEPSRVSTAGAEEAFPNLAEVPTRTPTHTGSGQREEIVEEMIEDRAEATYTEPAPLETAAPRDPFASSLIISGDEVTSREGMAGLPATTAAGPGQLAAIIFFGHGSASLDAHDRGVLRDIAALQSQRGGSLRIVGHSSSRTRNSTPDEHQLANFEMSLERANAVLDELVALGVPADAAHAEAVGDAEPVYHEFMPSGEAGNRRVEIFLEN